MALPPVASEPDLSRLGANLKQLREQRGLSHDNLAERADLSRRTIIDLEQGRSSGTVRSWHKIAQALGMRLTEVLAIIDN
ncbi:MAG: helix-turn-helix domain-containing protein [Actinobacteria bacterium]|nr:helix-turn-helix domain-containing protein [Actinomycetota bacterium]MBU1609482.1 helix-turn-helix domain-containing protein [Actinomycetota bacterium]MBU2315248.1 helix-turn-helix domain-containing protein [Actinomycetota bacterium]MBU2386332.1 helix-turn-helix domain-containing protein [Actinomycetota bacterium]